MNQKLLSCLFRKQQPLNCSGKRFNPLSIGFLIIASGLSFGSSAIAQEYPGCFLETPEGEVVFLTEICPTPEPEPLPGSSASTSPQGRVYQAQIIARDGNIPVIEAVFNNQRAFRMLVDTGASNTVITPIMAEFLGVVPSGRETANTPSARNVEFDIGLIESINVAGAVKDNLAVAIAPALDFGLLGQDFFGQYDVTIKQDVIEFRERSASPQTPRNSEPSESSEPVGEPSQPFENRPVGEPAEVFESEPVGEPSLPSNRSTDSDSDTSLPSNRSTDSSDQPSTAPSNRSTDSSESSSGESSN
ncbi:MAG: retropepsin-like aspartic protease [Microcoleaceae cyanobacterium]